MSYDVQLTFCKQDADRILSTCGYTPESDIAHIGNRIKAVIAAMMRASDGYKSVEPWFASLCDITSVSAIVPNKDGSQDFQFTLLPDKHLPALPQGVLDALVETPSAFIATI